MYYNTTKETTDNLREAIRNAKTKTKTVFLLAQSFRDGFTPDQLQQRWELLTGTRQSLNTVRRSITNLTDEGKLIKTSRYGISHMGKKMHIWICA